MTRVWQTLSHAAEEAMADPAGRPAKPRAEPGRPMVQERHHTRCRDAQTLLERRLRRVARRAAEAVRGCPARLRAKLDRDIAGFGGDFPEVLNMRSYEDLAFYLNEQAEQEAQRSRAIRIRQWKDGIQDDVKAMARWITAQEGVDTSSPQQLQESPSKGAAAQRLTSSLGSLWSEAENVDMTFLETFLGDLGPDRLRSDCGFALDGHLLMRRARRAKDKAGGLDGWSGALFAKLPLAFFERLSQVWQLVLQGCGVPEGWRQIRVVAIPKPDGGLRPLALTQLAWRVGSSELLSQLTAWFGRWMPPELCGRLPGRSADTIHEDLGTFVQRRSTSRTFVGCKADVRKCFDRVSPRVALRILRWWGAPGWLLELLEDFYDNQDRWVSVTGTFAPAPVRATCSLLQGCPFSPLLVNSMMAAWALHVRRRPHRFTSASFWMIGLCTRRGPGRWHTWWRRLWRGRRRTEPWALRCTPTSWLLSAAMCSSAKPSLSTLTCSGCPRRTSCSWASTTGWRATRLLRPRMSRIGGKAPQPVADQVMVGHPIVLLTVVAEQPRRRQPKINVARQLPPSAVRACALALSSVHCPDDALGEVAGQRVRILDAVPVAEKHKLLPRAPCPLDHLLGHGIARHLVSSMQVDTQNQQRSLLPPPHLDGRNAPTELELLR